MTDQITSGSLTASSAAQPRNMEKNIQDNLSRIYRRIYKAPVNSEIFSQLEDLGLDFSEALRNKPIKMAAIRDMEPSGARDKLMEMAREKEDGQIKAKDLFSKINWGRIDSKKALFEKDDFKAREVVAGTVTNLAGPARKPGLAGEAKSLGQDFSRGLQGIAEKAEERRVNQATGTEAWEREWENPGH